MQQAADTEERVIEHGGKSEEPCYQGIDLYIRSRIQGIVTRDHVFMRTLNLKATSCAGTHLHRHWSSISTIIHKI